MMDFYDIVDQVIALIQQRGRVSYSAVKLQFKLDDETLAALKDELIFAHPVVDEENRGLVWTGESGPTSEPISQQTPLQEPTQEVQPTQAELPPPEPHTPDAERRQLTVKFCDLVGSTNLSGELDPEDYREVVRQYQQVCSEVIQRYDGHIAQYLGDGLLVYFGFPLAHEDDAQRAVRSGLGIIEAIGALNIRLERDKGINLAIRLGIHTGLVVVGEMGGEGRQEQLALGETPNIAARIQSIAEPDTVVISADTYRLIQGYFDCESLGEHVLRGVSQPIVVYRVLGDTGIQSRLDVVSARGLTPLVGRESETTLLFERWEQIKNGQGQVVLLSGEGGIGKSRLILVLKDHIAGEPHTWMECRSLPYFTNSALYPITDFLQRTLRFQADDTPERRLEKLEESLRQYRLPLEETVPLFGALLSLPVTEDQYPPLTLSPQRQRQKTLEAIVAIILELTERQPVLFLLEDLHWTDPTTLELLELLVDQTPTASVYALLTCRPEFQPTWSYRSYLTEVTINRLSSAQVEQVVDGLTGGKRLPDAVFEQIVEKTDGVPLFVEEMTKAVLESSALKEVNGQYELAGSLTSLTIPATLQDSLMARLDRLVTAKGVAQLAATIGRQFTYELLQAVSQLDAAMLQHELGRLVEAEIVYQRGLLPQATFTFKHALIQDAAYQSLLKSTRQQYHQRIAQRLEERFSETVANQPELLAHHYTEAGLMDQAMRYWQQAGEQAVQRSTHVEAIAHLAKGLEMLKTLPDTIERAQRELTLQRNLGVSLLASKGFAASEVEAVYARARELCERVGDTSQIFPVLFGLWGFYQVRGDLQTARELAEQLLALAQHQHDPSLILQGHRALGDTLYWLGEFAPALAQLEQGIALYAPQQHRAHAFLYGQDPGIGCRVYAALVLWVLGYPAQALRRSREALRLAREFYHPFSMALTLALTATFERLIREWQTLRERTEALLGLAAEQGFAQLVGEALLHQGWIVVMQGHAEEGSAQIRQGLTARGTTGAVVRTHFLALLVEAQMQGGQVEEGLNTIAEALSGMDKTGERWYEAELYRLKGEILISQSSDKHTESESCFHQAISIAQSQSAKSWELRAATSLARLWQSQGKQQESYDLLAPVYGWFTEGFDTADLIDAKALLDELAEGSS
jgi:TOMM system kinase/cyclase fusion protein